MPTQWIYSSFNTTLSNRISACIRFQSGLKILAPKAEAWACFKAPPGCKYKRNTCIQQSGEGSESLQMHPSCFYQTESWHVQPNICIWLEDILEEQETYISLAILNHSGKSKVEGIRPWGKQSSGMCVCVPTNIWSQFSSFDGSYRLPGLNIICSTHTCC